MKISKSLAYLLLLISVGGGVVKAEASPSQTESSSSLSQAEIDAFYQFAPQPFNARSPMPITLQNAMNFSKTEGIRAFFEQTYKKEDAQKALQEAKDQYIASINSAGVQQAISAIQPLLNNLQNSVNANPVGNQSGANQVQQNAINALNSTLNNIRGYLSDYTNNYNDMKNKLNSISPWGGNSLTWGVNYNGKAYGFNDKDSIGPDIRNNAMYKNGQGNINSLNIKMNDLQNNIKQAQNAAIILASAKEVLGKNTAYTDALNQVQTILNSLQKSLDNTGVDTQKNLQEAFDKFLEAQEQVNYTFQAIIALNKLHQQATQTLAKEQQSLSNLASNFSSNMTKVNFASSLATDSRLAKLSNPYSQDTEFAAYIEEIKNKSLAANTVKTNANTASDFTSSLSPSVYAYDLLRFKKNNNLWGNLGTIIGNSNSVNSVSGVFSFGYDAWVKNMILGAYGSYAYTTDGIANVASSNKSHNADIGFYSRFFLGQNEIDLNLGESFGFNFLQFQESLLGTTLKSDYVSFQTHLDLTYGYVFKIGKGWFSKPFIGINYNYGYNLGMDAKATDISMGFDPFQTHFGAIRAGLELRKYFNDNQSYFYIAPAFYQGVLFENTQTIQTRIYESNFAQNTTSLSPNQSLDTSFLIKAGGEWQAGDNIFINISVGAKLGNLSQYGMLNLGGRWVF